MSCGTNIALAALMAAVAGLAPAFADEAGPGASVVSIDWQRGVVLARGAAAADLKAKNPDVARTGAHRQARERARARLVEVLPQVPLADGLSLSSGWDELASRATVAVETFHSDGSAEVELRLGVEAIRQQLLGPLGAKPAGGTIIVDARKLGLPPAVGYQLVAGDVVIDAPSLFVTSEKEAHRDRRALKPIQRFVAASLRGRSVELDGSAASALAGASARGLLIVFLVNKAGK